MKSMDVKATSTPAASSIATTPAATTTSAAFSVQDRLAVAAGIVLGAPRRVKAWSL
jgi:hypothetical protein